MRKMSNFNCRMDCKFSHFVAMVDYSVLRNLLEIMSKSIIFSFHIQYYFQYEMLIIAQ